MKAIKYLLIGAMLTVSTSMSAQSAAYQSEVNAIWKVLQENKGNADAAKKMEKEFVKKYKKDPAALVQLGKAFLAENYMEKAQYYADMVMKKNKNYGDAYVLLGDIEQLKDQENEGGKAAYWYQNAMTMDPKNPNGYINYANIFRESTTIFDETMSKLKQEVPSYPVEAAAGHSFYVINKFRKAYDYYSKSDPNTIDESQLYEYVLTAYYTENKDKALEVAKIGMRRFAGKEMEHYFTRYALYNAVDLDKMDEASKDATALENSKLEKIYKDYLYFGRTLLAEQKYNEAIEKFNKSLEMKEDATDNYKYLSEAYSALGVEDVAIDYSVKYLTVAEDVMPADFVNLVNVYTQKAEKGDYELNMEKAMDVYSKMAEKFPTSNYYAFLQQGNIAEKLKRSDLAESRWLAVIELLQDKTEYNSTEKMCLIAALKQLGVKIWREKGISNAAQYLDRLVELAPDDSIVKNYLEQKKK